MKVTTTTLQMLQPPAWTARPFPEEARLDRADGVTPEFARFLYGLVGLLLEHGITAAWSLTHRVDLPQVTRVWVHTCSLDGPAALANYQSRGFVPCGIEEEDTEVAAEPLGSWVATGGR